MGADFDRFGLAARRIVGRNVQTLHRPSKDHVLRQLRLSRFDRFARPKSLCPRPTAFELRCNFDIGRVCIGDRTVLHRKHRNGYHVQFVVRLLHTLPSRFPVCVHWSDTRSSNKHPQNSAANHSDGNPDHRIVLHDFKQRKSNRLLATVWNQSGLAGSKERISVGVTAFDREGATSAKQEVGSLPEAKR